MKERRRGLFIIIKNHWLLGLSMLVLLMTYLVGIYFTIITHECVYCPQSLIGPFITLIIYILISLPCSLIVKFIFRDFPCLYYNLWYILSTIVIFLIYMITNRYIL